MDDHDRVKAVIRSDVPNQPPLAGEVPFFLGVNHLNAIKAADDVPDVELLVRSCSWINVIKYARTSNLKSTKKWSLSDPALIKRVSPDLFALFLFLTFPLLARRFVMSESLPLLPNAGFVQRPECRALFNVP